MADLANKVILVAGGAGGIGAATAERLLDGGATVIIGDCKQVSLDLSAERLSANSGEIFAQLFDIADEESIRNLVKSSVDRYGRLDGVVVTVADLSTDTLGNDVPVPAMEAAIWERTLRVNLIGHALLFREAIPHLRNSGGGAIATTSSGSAYLGQPEMPAYAASKAGLHALIRHTARIGGPDNIRCNGIAPGFILTEGAQANMTDEIWERVSELQVLSKTGMPTDIASAFAFLMSDSAGWITGQVISVNGGAGFRD